MQEELEDLVEDRGEGQPPLEENALDEKIDCRIEGIDLEVVPEVFDSLPNALALLAQDLLDTTARNRLIKVDPKFMIKVMNDNLGGIVCQMTKEDNFSVEIHGAEGMGDLFANDDANEDANTRAKQLQSEMLKAEITKRLNLIRTDAKELLDDRGIRTFGLGFGMLKWADGNKHLESPIFILNLDLKVPSVSNSIKADEDGVILNDCLILRIQQDFQTDLKDFIKYDDEGVVDVEQSLAALCEWSKGNPNFEVVNKAGWIGKYNFVKLPIYSDIHRIAKVGEGSFPDETQIDFLKFLLLPEGKGNIDTNAIYPTKFGANFKYLEDTIRLSTMKYIYQGDYSQSVAIEKVKEGKDMVIQGPPGTGKSQTICNIIGEALLKNQTVLFVSDKMAALDVVHGRLKAAGLESQCLELHGAKHNKNAVKASLKSAIKYKYSNNDEENNQNVEGIDGLVKEIDLDRSKVKDTNRFGNSFLSCLGMLGSSTLVIPEEALSNLSHLKEWKLAQYENAQTVVTRYEKQYDELSEDEKRIWGQCLRGENINEGDLNGLDSRLQEILEISEKIRILEENLMRLLCISNSGKGANDRLLIYERIALKKSLQIDEGIEIDWSYLFKNLEVINSVIEDVNVQDNRKHNIELVFQSDLWALDKLQLVSTFRNNIHKNPLWLTKRWWVRRRVKALLQDSNNIHSKDLLVKTIDLVADFEYNKLELKKKLEILYPICVSGTQDLSIDFYRRLSKIALKCEIDMSETAVAFIKADWPFISICITDIKDSYTQLKVKMKSICAELTINHQFSYDFCEWPNVWQSGHDMRAYLRPGLQNWIRFVAIRNDVTNQGLLPIIEYIEASNDKIDLDVCKVLKEVYFKFHIDIITSDSQWDSIAYHDRLKSFRDKDEIRQIVARREIQKNYSGRVHEVVTSNRQSFKNINMATASTVRFRLRSLISDNAQELQALKPVFLMSPVSVAQFLELSKIKFDLLIMDEASQIRPVDAFGSIFRSRQVVIVGDSKQLPPTRMFERISKDDEDLSYPLGKLESILSLVDIAGLSQALLTRHYRSEHESLIYSSNKMFYENKLEITPSPYHDVPHLGLKFVNVTNGVYDAGGTRTNHIEALAVVNAVLHHINDDDLKLSSLFVGTFSVQQKRMIEELLLEHREAINAFNELHSSDDKNEPFLVKNLENIQGDERDVVFISVGYGKDSKGDFSHSLGSFNNNGGERRLNVLITRAKRSCVVFSSILPEVITNPLHNPSIRTLKSFLSYAHTRASIVNQEATEFAENDFERSVKNSLEIYLRKDWPDLEIRSQIHEGKRRIDLGLYLPSHPGRCILGVECDGYTYHSQDSAMERDRLRTLELKRKGWKLTRVLSREYWYNRSAALENIKIDFEAALLNM